MLWPPRRLDMRAAMLGGTFLWSVMQLRYDYTGKSSLHRLQTSVANMDPASSAPSERYAETQRLIREEKARRERARELRAQGLSDEDIRRVQELERRTKAAAAPQKGEGERGTLETIWMGDAQDDWKEKRAQKEREALQEGGGGIWGLISEQISDVFGHGEKKAQEEAARRKKENGNGENKP
ncbi:hypothetical protein JX266_001615 [Neoarthrinium moseri]|uniref:uncharacterized protein n=1 Tax=Neoarthrinium moseri TaxID=1658444 RepID=UPI001FDCAF05|nr:uncharacterized protein JN550_006790 [Neoarthrinium moseri]KAI1853631.1 hypothetical protein JX266_001615 [Neoarthrinium moseri]KAI1867983.1 hypothetical protein JN550_006790 [Neoarthrinium moseri]